MTDVDPSISPLDRAKLEIERSKIELEQRKLVVEQSKARWSAAAVGVPLVALAVTAATGVWTQHRQSQLTFALKAAEIIMSTDSPVVTKNKAKALSTLFPSNLPRDFASSFDENAYGFVTHDPKRELVDLLFAKPESATTIVRVWGAAYPDDEWLKPINAALTNEKPSTPKK